MPQYKLQTILMARLEPPRNKLWYDLVRSAWLLRFCILGILRHIETKFPRNESMSRDQWLASGWQAASVRLAATVARHHPPQLATVLQWLPMQPWLGRIEILFYPNTMYSKCTSTYLDSGTTKSREGMKGNGIQKYNLPCTSQSILWPMSSSLV